MGTSLAVIEAEFKPRLPIFADVLRSYSLPVEAIRGSLMVSIERNPTLLDCSPQSIISGAMSLAVLGLRVDGVTGQGFLIPFGGRAQPVIGVNGFTVIAGRAGYTLQAFAYREGDKLAEIGGSDPRIEHQIDPSHKGKLIGVYAVARSNTMPTMFSPLITLDELIAARDSSKGYQSAKKRGKEHPWSTHFEQMCLKTAKRRLAKDIPNDMLQRAAWLDGQHDAGKLGALRPDAQGVIEAEAVDVIEAESPLPERQPEPDRPPISLEPPRWNWRRSDGKELTFSSRSQWMAQILATAEKINDPSALLDALRRNAAIFQQIEARGQKEAVEELRRAINARINMLDPPPAG